MSRHLKVVFVAPSLKRKQKIISEHRFSCFSEVAFEALGIAIILGVKLIKIIFYAVAEFLIEILTKLLAEITA